MCAVIKHLENAEKNPTEKSVKMHFTRGVYFSHDLSHVLNESEKNGEKEFE